MAEKSERLQDRTVYLLKTELHGLPGAEVFRHAGCTLIQALAWPWRRPVVIKPNVPLRFSPNSGVVTHPAFVGGLVDGLLACGLSPAEIIVAEGGGHEAHDDMEQIFAASGYTDELARRGVELRSLNRDAYLVSTDFSRRVLHHLYISRTIAEGAGTLLNVPKMKCHNFATVTLAVKNMQGMLTPLRHRHLCTQYPRYEGDDGQGLDLRILDKPERFFDKLVDLATAIHPDLHIVEGIVGRDGTGFHRGKNIPLGIALAGQNPLAVDHVGAMLMGFQPEEVGFLRAAVARGLWILDTKAIEVLALRDGVWQPCPDWLRYRAEPPFELIRRDDVKYQE